MILSPAQIGYFAGVIDARAHIEISARRDKPVPRLAVTTKRKELLTYLCTMTGAKISDEGRGYQRRPCGIHCTHEHEEVVRQSAKWRADSGRATIILAACLPLMHAQVDLAIEALRIGMESFPPTRGNTITQMKVLGWPIPEPPKRRP